MARLENLLEIATWPEWRAAHPIREWKNRHGQSCFFARYGDKEHEEYHVGASKDAALWQVDQGQRCLRDMFKPIVWC